MKADQSCGKHDAPSYARFSATALRWALLAMMCFGMMGPAQAADKPAGKAPAAAKTLHEARVPADDIAEAILKRKQSSRVDSTTVLMPFEGFWDYTGQLWTDPKAQPSLAQGTVTNELIVDQHYLSSKASGNVNIGRQALPFEGMELTGFDSARKAYVSTSVDTMMTGLMVGSGTYDAKTHTVNQAGHFTNPLTGAEDRFRSELTLVDDAHYKRTVWTTDKSGKETKLIEADYTKRK